jgi:ribosomal protein S18 acetylase RimI-like enzyme
VKLGTLPFGKTLKIKDRRFGRQVMEIRIAREEDIPALVEFNQAMALETEHKTLDGDVLTAGVSAVFGDQSKGFYVVIEDSGIVAAGLMVTTEWSDWRNGWFWWIQSVYVRPKHRGRGLYGEMYEFVKSKAREAGNVCGFRLYVEKENGKAQRVYEKLGMDRTYYLMYEEETKNRST